MRKKDFTFVQCGYIIEKANVKFASYEKGDKKREWRKRDN